MLARTQGLDDCCFFFSILGVETRPETWGMREGRGGRAGVLAWHGCSGRCWGRGRQAGSRSMVVPPASTVLRPRCCLYHTTDSRRKSKDTEEREGAADPHHNKEHTPARRALFHISRNDCCKIVDTPDEGKKRGPRRARGPLSSAVCSFALLWVPFLRSSVCFPCAVSRLGPPR